MNFREILAALLDYLYKLRASFETEAEEGQDGIDILPPEPEPDPEAPPAAVADAPEAEVEEGLDAPEDGTEDAPVDGTVDPSAEGELPCEPDCLTPEPAPGVDDAPVQEERPPMMPVDPILVEDEPEVVAEEPDPVAPVVEAPVVDEPAEAPVANDPVEDTPVEDDPVPMPPVVELPVEEELVAQPPVMEAPVEPEPEPEPVVPDPEPEPEEPPFVAEPPEETPAPPVFDEPVPVPPEPEPEPEPEPVPEPEPEEPVVVEPPQETPVPPVLEEPVPVPPEPEPEPEPEPVPEMPLASSAPELPDSAYDIGWDGLTAEEQLMVELVNRARLDPVAENARQEDGFAAGVTTAPKEALAVVETLSDAADGHSQDMDARNFFDHTNPDGAQPWDRAEVAGHENGFVGENISWAGTTGRYGDLEPWVQRHHDGLWESDGHQQNFMSENWSEIGVGYDYGDHVVNGVNYSSSTFTTQKFGDTGKTYLTGVVIDDADGDAFYDLGEGQGDVRITAWNEEGVHSTATWDSGGYTLELAPGTYNVAFEGGDLDGVYETTVVIGSENVKLDVIEDRDVVGDVASGQSDQPAIALTVMSAMPEDPMAAAVDHLLNGTLDEAAMAAYPEEGFDDMTDEELLV